MNKKKYNLIQIHAALSLIGYWFFQSIFVRFYGETTQLSSIVYEGGQLALSLYVISICTPLKKHYGSKHTMLTFFSILLILYALRMVFDMVGGPFRDKVPPIQFLRDFLLVVCLCFTAAWALIASRHWLDVDKITKIVFWLGIVSILFILSDLQSVALQSDYEEQRMEVSGGLSSLSVVRLACITVIAGVHLLINGADKYFYKAVYLAGIVLGIWLSLASGSRGGIVGLVIGIGAYFLFSSRRNPLLVGGTVVILVLFVVNIVPILTFLADYFPVFSNRMLMTILENDQSTRDELRKQAYDLIFDNPIFGYSYRMLAGGSGYRTHNGILDVMLALGIPVGLLFIYFVYIRGSLLAIKNMTNKTLFFPTVMMVFVLVTSISSSSITDSGFNFAFILLCAVCYRKKQAEKPFELVYNKNK